MTREAQRAGYNLAPYKPPFVIYFTLGDTVHPKIATAIGPLLSELSALGTQFGGTAYSEQSFGDFYVDCSLGGKQFRLFRDRGQYMVDGDMDELKRIGLWRAFNSVEEYSTAVVNAVVRYAKPVA